MKLFQLFLVFYLATFLSKAEITSDIPADHPPVQGTCPKEIIHQTLIGFSHQLHLKAPCTVLKCLDDPVSLNITQFYYSIISKLATSDFITIDDAVKDFRANFPAPVSYCIETNPEIQNILDILGLKNVSLSDLYSRFTIYLLSGKFKDLIDRSYEIQKVYNKEKYEEAGALTCDLIETVLYFDTESRVFLYFLALFNFS